MKHVRAEIYADGAASPNPGAGGYGVIVDCCGQRREISAGFRKTTNNRMELMGVIEGLKAVDRSLPVTVHSDSRYVVDMLNGGHAQRWRANRWMRNVRQRAENPDLWSELLELCSGRDVEFKWVRGHNENPENERCDVLAVRARQGEGLPPDTGFESIEAATPKQVELDFG